MRAHFADLVEKYSTVMGQLELAWLVARRTGKRALVISEQLRFQQFVRESGTIHPHKRAIGAIGVPVNVTGEYVFTNARLTQDQNGNIRLSDVPGDIDDSQHLRIRRHESSRGACALLVKGFNFLARLVH